MSDDRRMDVLRTIVEEYISNPEPVGSRVLSQRHALGVSPATLRIDMAALEEAGYLAQPHTSAGRIPTDKGYRYFVDQLSSVKPLSPAERRAITTFLEDATDLDDIVERTVRTLAGLTHQLAVVQYPSLHRSTVRHIDLIDVGGSRLLIVIIADNGRVEQRLVPCESMPDEQSLALLRDRLNAITQGHVLSEIRGELDALADHTEAQSQALVRDVLGVVVGVLSQSSPERVVLAGTANLARSEQDFASSVQPVLDAIEEHVVLLKLFGEMSGDPGDVAVRIGHENTHDGLSETSVVSTSYGDGHAVVARLGVLGPTRMDYSASIASVRAVARYLGRILAG